MVSGCVGGDGTLDAAAAGTPSRQVTKDGAARRSHQWQGAERPTNVTHREGRKAGKALHLPSRWRTTLHAGRGQFSTLPGIVCENETTMY